MSSKTIEEIALDLSNELEDVYFAELTKALYQYNDFEIMTGIGEEGVNKPDPTIEDKLHAVSSELKKITASDLLSP